MLTIAGLTVLQATAASLQAKEAAPAETMAPRDGGEPIMAIVSIKSQQVTFYDEQGWIFSAPVSTGTTGRETPAGVFAVIEKEREHYSSLYDDASMPHMQRITWNGLALHGGPLPGYAASHGCIRMPFGFAKKLYDKTRIGMRVIVSPNDATPVDFSHVTLPVPDAQAVAAAPERAEALAGEAAEAAKFAVETKKAAAKAARDAAVAKAALSKLGAARKAADAGVAYAEKLVAGAKSDEAKAQADGVKLKEAAKTEKAKSRAEDLMAKAVARAEKAKARADELKSNAVAKAAEAAGKLKAAEPESAAKIDAAAKAAEAAKAAADKKTATANAAADAKLAVEPVSIYISRATQKLYVRRPTHKPWPDGGEVFDASIEAPVTIRDPDKPLGTHVLTATAANDKGLNWTAVTIDYGDEAKAALDRITMPKEVLDRIAPTLLPRSSIIVSDEPLSKETNYRTEFVAVLSNQPQGGFITRKPTYSPDPYGKSWESGPGFFSFFDGPAPPPRRRNRSYQAQQFWW